MGDLVGPDVLCNATSLGSDDIGLPDCIQQGRLSMVNVAKNTDDWRPINQLLLRLFLLFWLFLFLCGCFPTMFDLKGETMVVRQALGHILLNSGIH